VLPGANEGGFLPAVIGPLLIPVGTSLCLGTAAATSKSTDVLDKPSRF
jgi:hypothetical protein